MGGGAVKKINPFDSEGTIGRAILTGGLSLPVEMAMKATAPTDIGAPDAIAPPPTMDDPAIATAEADARKARGRASTIIAGGNRSGASGLVAKRTLLGT